MICYKRSAAKWSIFIGLIKIIFWYTTIFIWPFFICSLGHLKLSSPFGRYMLSVGGVCFKLAVYKTIKRKKKKETVSSYLVWGRTFRQTLCPCLSQPFYIAAIRSLELFNILNSYSIVGFLSANFYLLKKKKKEAFRDNKILIFFLEHYDRLFAFQLKKNQYGRLLRLIPSPLRDRRENEWWLR